MVDNSKVQRSRGLKTSVNDHLSTAVFNSWYEVFVLIFDILIVVCYCPISPFWSHLLKECKPKQRHHVSLRDMSPSPGNHSKQDIFVLFYYLFIFIVIP